MRSEFADKADNICLRQRVVVLSQRELRTASTSPSTARLLTEGYTTTDSHEQGAGYQWICKPCLDDFAERFAWRVVPSAD